MQLGNGGAQHRVLPEPGRGRAAELLLAGMFAGEAKGLMLNISLITFAAAAAVLVFLTVAKKRDEEPAGDKTDDE